MKHVIHIFDLLIRGGILTPQDGRTPTELRCGFHHLFMKSGGFGQG